MFSLYIHIPFCVSKCHYCDFYSLGMGKKVLPEEAYVEALSREVGRLGLVLSEFGEGTIPTIFFGGGTPSLFEPQSIGNILRETRTLGTPSEQAELTLEVNPKTAHPEKLEGYREVGINRVSMGVQSLDKDILDTLGRAHTGEEALQSLSWIIQAAFPQISVDLMYGLPDQSPQALTRTLSALEPFPVQHLSAYELIIEEHTPFYDWHRSGKLSLPPTDTVLGMRDEIESFVAQKGMKRYEISNYAVPGAESRHNRGYWDYEGFLGLGAGAVSFLRKEQINPEWIARLGIEKQKNVYGYRWTNPRDLKKYLAEPGDRRLEDMEVISRGTAFSEYMMMGLRKSNGIRFEDFEKKFQQGLPDKFRSTLEKFEKNGLLETDDEGFRLSSQGILLSNEVLQEFL